MKVTNVLSPEYMEFQKEIYALYEKWTETLSSQTIVKNEKVTEVEYPLLPQLELRFDKNDYHTFINDLLTVVKKNKPELNSDVSQLEATLDPDTLDKWFKEAVTVNTFYFADFAEKNALPDWLSYFIAEHALRPYLQKAATELSEGIPQGHKGGCPICGEPARLALMNKNGKKEVTCPRCHFAWEEKKISCAHCGTDEQGQIVILKVEDDDHAEIHACKACNSYTKVIDTRKLIKVPVPELVDLQTIHLDYIAQEKGYGEEEAKDAN